MTPDDLAQALRVTDDHGRERTPSCPDEMAIGGYVDGLLDAADRERVELHVADCDRCLALVGLLSRDRSEPAPEAVPDITQARARKLGTPAARPWLRFAPQWAAAAVVVLSIPVLLQVTQRPEDMQAVQRGGGERVTRNAAPISRGLEVLQPVAGAVVEPRQLAVVWTALPGSGYYDVRIVSDAGDVVIEQRVTGTEWRAPENLELRPGAEYYVRVEGHPAGGQAVASSHVPFWTPD